VETAEGRQDPPSVLRRVGASPPRFVGGRPRRVRDPRPRWGDRRGGAPRPSDRVPLSVARLACTRRRGASQAPAGCQPAAIVDHRRRPVVERAGDVIRSTHDGSSRGPRSPRGVHTQVLSEVTTDRDIVTHFGASPQSRCPPRRPAPPSGRPGSPRGFCLPRRRPARWRSSIATPRIDVRRIRERPIAAPSPRPAQGSCRISPAGSSSPGRRSSWESEAASILIGPRGASRMRLAVRTQRAPRGESCRSP
jgi:hypothetical protein